MSTRIRRTQKYDIARLKCDCCGRTSCFEAIGRNCNPIEQRAELRRHCRTDGWGISPAVGRDGTRYQTDICPRCVRQLEKFL